MSMFVLHIGLHKTATKYFQHMVFPYLPTDQFVYNPPRLTQQLMDYVKADDGDRNAVTASLLAEVARFSSENHGKTCLISREILCGDLFSAYADWNKQIDLLHRVMPDARILISLRFQTDWLVSCYRESLHEHHYQDFADFIGLKDSPDTRFNAAGYAVLDPKMLDYTSMLQYLLSVYPKDRVNVFFYEDFRRQPDVTEAAVLAAVGADRFDHPKPKGIPNRGYSARAISLSISRVKWMKRFGLDGLVHRPISFYGPNSIPAGSQELSVLPKNRYWGDQFLRDNEEVRSAGYPRLSVLDKLKREFTWRYFIKQRFDRLFYKDWDVASKCRDSLNQHFRTINAPLVDLVAPRQVPAVYLNDTK